MKAYALTTADKPAAPVELPDPELRSDGALIRVHAASVNGVDVGEAHGFLASMMPHDYPVVIGRDFAGVVEAVGSDATALTVGDEVLGFIPLTPPLHDGTWAELIAVGPDAPLTRKPANISFEIAAAIPLAAVTALDAVHAADIHEGDTVVVIGATGGVGSFAVQLAAHLGATVIGTARAGEEASHVRAMGASETIDYTTSNVVDALSDRYPDGIDVLIDLVNRDADAFAASAALVRSGGRIATTMGAADVDGLAARGVWAVNIMATPTPEKLAELVQRVDDGSIRVEVQEVFPLENGAAALAAFSAGAVGKLVVKVA
jgi:NADPH:quinone reductase